MMYGFRFNNRHSSEFGIYMLSSDRTILPAKIQQSYTIQGRDGTYDVGDITYQSRQISVQISFWGTEQNMETLRDRIREIAKWLSGQGNLIFDDEPDKAYNAKVLSGISLTQIVRMGQATIAFTCQPFAESVQYITETKDITASNDSMTVQVNGTQDTPCILTIKNTGTTNITGITIQRKAGRA